MDSLLVDKKEVQPQELKGFLPRRQVFENIFNWFSSLFSLAEEEKKEVIK
jgi:Zn-dependent oligopeptidase